MGKSPEELELDRERVAIDRQRLAIDAEREKREGRFFSRHMGSIVTLIVSLTAAGFSYSQFQANTLQQQQTAEQNGIRHGHELKRQEQELKLKILDFVSRNLDIIFTERDDKAHRIRDILLVTLPPDVTERLFARLQATATTSGDLQIWTEGRAQARALAPKDAATPPVEPVVEDAAPSGRVFLHYQDAADEPLMDEMAAALRASGYRVPSHQLVTQATQGDVRYYYEDELELANRVSGIAGDVLERGGRPRLAKTVPIYKIGGPFKDLPRGTVEVWVPRRKAPARQQVARRAPRAARP